MVSILVGLWSELEVDFMVDKDTLGKQKPNKECSNYTLNLPIMYLSYYLIFISPSVSFLNALQKQK